MRLATSSNIVCERPDGSVFPLEKTLQLASQAGFDTFDISFYDWALPHSPFLTEDWERWILGIAEAADRLGVRFGQCHAYTYHFLNPDLDAEERDRHQLLTQRSIYCCALLDSRLCVTHPDTDWESDQPDKKSIKKNIDYFKRLLDYSLKLGIDLAVENMCDFNVLPKHKFGTQPEELLAFAETFNSPHMGICWDFEHADIMQIDQRRALLLLRDHLKATHVSDTNSWVDDTRMHVMPFFGSIDWTEVMKTLREIGYQGDFCFEAHNYAKRLPDMLLPTALKLSFEIGQYLMQLSR